MKQKGCIAMKGKAMLALGAMTVGFGGLSAAEPSVCASAGVSLDARSTACAAAVAAGPVEGRSNVWTASPGTNLKTTTANGAVIIFR